MLFLSHATDLVGIETDGSSQLYLRDVAGGGDPIVEPNPAAQVPAIDDVSLHWMNARGDQVVFDLFDDALVAGDQNRLRDVFGVDLEAGTLDLFSTGFPRKPLVHRGGTKRSSERRGERGRPLYRVCEQRGRSGAE